MSPLAGPAARSLPDPATALQQRVAAIPVHTPRQLDARLEALGYRGQAAARRAACVLAWRHVRRLQRLHLDGIDPSELPDRDSYLLLGPTGCGKTHLVELLFREVLEVPAVVVDITQFSETGYVGNDVGTILTRLVAAAGGNPAWAACGVVCLDEFDKLAGSTSTARFAGAETTKDVSGWGVQRSLLGLLSGTYAEYQPDYGYSGRTAPSHLPLAGITFLACGAFSGVRQARESVRPVGFGEGRPGESRAARPALEPAALERFGFMPELIGRFTRVVELEPLALPELRRILDRQACLQARELGTEGLRLDLDEAELTGMAERALRSGHGARGLRAALALRIEELVYDGAVEPVGRPR